MDNWNTQEVIATAASCCADLVNHSDVLMQLLFNGHQIENFLIFDHLGVLTPSCHEDAMDSCLNSLDYQVQERFASTVMADFLRHACDLPDLQVQITKAYHKLFPERKLEFFTPSSALVDLNAGWLAQEVSHIAFRPVFSTTPKNKLHDAIRNCGFGLGMAGVNPNEHQSTNQWSPNGVVVQYFNKVVPILGRIKIELVTTSTEPITQVSNMVNPALAVAA
ncbi:hypothetical protein TI04_09105 [Achromatium sp. WMS2]|nr:hypothetical protein TI04_09105 [Achromatium sp. WMS2]